MAICSEFQQITKHGVNLYIWLSLVTGCIEFLRTWNKAEAKFRPHLAKQHFPSKENLCQLHLWLKPDGLQSICVPSLSDQSKLPSGYDRNDYTLTCAGLLSIDCRPKRKFIAFHSLCLGTRSGNCDPLFFFVSTVDFQVCDTSNLTVLHLHFSSGLFISVFLCLLQNCSRGLARNGSVSQCCRENVFAGKEQLVLLRRQCCCISSELD